MFSICSINKHDLLACKLTAYVYTFQPGLAGINLGKFLIKRVITLVKRDMPQISVSNVI